MYGNSEDSGGRLLKVQCNVLAIFVIGGLLGVAHCASPTTSNNVDTTPDLDVCHHTHFECKNYMCIKPNLRCNGIDDCGDGSDEVDCGLRPIKGPESCHDDEYLCKIPAFCIPLDELCGDFNECEDYDAIDKLCPFTCQPKKFKCHNATQCIPNRFICDGSKDCQDGSDEINCEDQKYKCREEADSFLCDDLSACIFAEEVCDGHEMCDDGSDEKNNCYDQCNKKNCGENTLCLPEGNGVKCVCIDGFEPDENDVCKEKKYCDASDYDRPCSQLCVEGHFGPSCRCLRGYRMHHDGRFCNASGPEAVVYVATATEIHQWTVESGKYSTLISGLNEVTALAVDSAKKRIFWAENGKDQAEIFSMNIDEGIKTKSVVYSFGLQKPVGLAYDFIANNLYIVDSGIPAILACRLEQNNCMSVFNNSVVKAPKEIVVNPAQGLLYYTEIGSDAAIMKGSMDGSSVAKMISTHRPHSLEIDFSTSRLYWIEGLYHTVFKIDFDGKKKQPVLSYKVKSPQMISTFEDSIYWVSDGSDVKSTNKFNGNDSRTVFHVAHQPTDLVISQESLQRNDVVNRCSTSRCHLCLLNSQGSGTCICLPGHKIAYTGLYCEQIKVHPFLFASDKTRIVRVNLNTTGRPEPTFIKTDSMYNVVALDYMSKSHMVLYSDFDREHKFQYIAMIGLDGSARSTPVASNLSSVPSIAVDEASRIVFWTDTVMNSIHVTSLDNHYKMKLPVKTDRPYGLAIQAVQGILYFSEMATSVKQAVIKRCRLDGASCSPLVSTRLLFPNYLFADTHQLYWSDAGLGEISCIDEWGNDRHTVVVTRGKPLSFAINLNILYWTEEGESSMFYKHIHTIGGFESKIAIKGNELTGLIAAIPHDLPDSACSFQNGGCEQICISIKRSLEVTCLCSEGYKLASDEKKCTRLAAEECTGFMCKGKNLCVQSEKKCDGFPDCHDASDEDDCEETCPAEDFQCGNGQCISKDDKCDGHVDCRDESDEKSEDCSNVCDPQDHRCDVNKCIPSNFLCDKLPDCDDKSDELLCNFVCDEYEFQCKENRDHCIPIGWRCDGDEDCFDGSDEKDCGSKRKDCNQDEFQCVNGDCIDKSEVCDQLDNCLGGEDEQHCSPPVCAKNEFMCDDETCIPKIKLCNTIRDCDFGEDERDCEIKCSSNEFQCFDGSCVAVKKRCNGIEECSDGSDEKSCLKNSQSPKPNTSVVEVTCQGFKCGMGQCIGLEQRCDGKPDCRDNTDELNCRTTCKTANRCAHVCVDIFSGIECQCNSGYRLMEDGYACEDINECVDQNGGCSHECVNLKGSVQGERGFKCVCSNGYVRGNDFFSCKARGSRPELYVSTKNGIKKFVVEERVADLMVIPMKYAPAKIELDVRREVIFWTEMHAVLFEMNLWRKGSYGPAEVIFKGLIIDMALDWITGNVYVLHDIHQGMMKISIIGTNGLNTTILLDQKSLTNLVLHPKRSLMFWVSSRPGQSSLKQASMNGLGMQEMSEASKHMDYNVKILSLDEATERLYWIDPVFGQLKSVSVFDKDVFTYDLSTNARHFRSMDVFEGVAYLLSADNVVQKFVTYGQRNERLTTIARVSYPEDIKVHHSMKQPIEYNACETKQCMYMCIFTSAGAQCQCPEGFYDGANSNCEGLPKRVTFVHPTTPSISLSSLSPVTTALPVSLIPAFKWDVSWTSKSEPSRGPATDKYNKPVVEYNQSGSKTSDVVKDGQKSGQKQPLVVTSECGAGCLNGGACVKEGNVKQCRCAQGFIGKRCEKLRKETINGQEDGNSTGLVIGVIIGLVIVLFVIIAGVCYFRYKRRGDNLNSSIRFKKQKQFVICNQEDKDVLVPEISFGNPGFQEEIDEEAHMQENQDWWKKLISRSRRSVDSAFHSKVGSDDAIDGFMKGDPLDAGDKVRLL